MTLTDKSVRDLLAAFRSSDPTPGGGSASALVGAVGAALLAMVANLDRPRAGTTEDVERLAAAGRRCAVLSDDLAGLIDRDSDAYDAVLAAYRLPKGTEDERRTRSERIQEAISAAISAPVAVMQSSLAALEQAAVVAVLGNRNATSDVQVAVELLRAAVQGAKFNVNVNVGSLKDAQQIQTVRAETARLVQVCEAAAARAGAELL